MHDDKEKEEEEGEKRSVPNGAACGSLVYSERERRNLPSVLRCFALTTRSKRSVRAKSTALI